MARKSTPAKAAAAANRAGTRAATASARTPAGKAAGTSTAKRTAAKKSTKKAAPAKKATAKQTAAKQTTAKAAPAKAATAKRATTKQAAPRKAATAEKAPTKAPAKKGAKSVKRAAPHKTVAKKAPARTAAKKAPAASATTAAPKPRPAKVSGFTAAELAEIRARLVAESEALLVEVGKAESDIADRLRDGVDGAGEDQADQGSKASEREHEISVANNMRDHIAQNERAVQRIDSGSYGVCESCGGPIGKERLRALPHATFCVACKQREERR